MGYTLCYKPFKNYNMRQIFNTPCKATQNRFKNKNKKVLRSEIVEMISKKEEKLNKNDLISLWQLLNGI